MYLFNLKVCILPLEHITKVVPINNGVEKTTALQENVIKSELFIINFIRPLAVPRTFLKSWGFYSTPFWLGTEFWVLFTVFWVLFTVKKDEQNTYVA